MEWLTLLSAKRVGQQRPSDPEQTRSSFEQDFDRIIFSHPFRRLQDKTQVHPMAEQDFVHTRLTHSLEVSSVGRSLGRKVGSVLIGRHPELSQLYSTTDFGSIVAAASLAHDLGNPPFGHAGENAISDFFSGNINGKMFREMVSEARWADLVNFEGNAQGFRILNKNRYGLKLTSATVGAFTKYPCPAFFPERNKAKKSQRKFGYFQSESEIFRHIAGELQLRVTSSFSWARHPLAFLVEASDDICYSIIDLEDGCNLGLVSVDEATSLYEGVITKSRSKLGKLTQLTTREERIGFLRALAIGDLVDECAEVFLDNESSIIQGDFDSALADNCASRDALKQIIDVSIERIYRARHVIEIEASGHEVLPGLLSKFCMAGHTLMTKGNARKYKNLALLLPADILADIQAHPDDVYSMLRHVIDFVSGLTDRYALTLYRKLKGIG